MVERGKTSNNIFDVTQCTTNAISRYKIHELIHILFFIISLRNLACYNILTSPVTFQVLSSPIWLMATILGSLGAKI